MRKRFVLEFDVNKQTQKPKTKHTFNFHIEDTTSKRRIHRTDDVSSEVEHVAVYRFNVKELAILTLVQLHELSLYTLSGYVGHVGFDFYGFFDSIEWR